VKLRHYGIRGNILAWIKSFLSNRSQQFLVKGVKFSPVPVTSGVSQGSVLGLLLFLVYINDMPARVKSTTTLFADDNLLYRKIRCPADTQALQEDITALQVWEQTWKMEFNPSKCEVLRITRKKNLFQATYSIHGHQLANVKTGKYLDVTFASDLSWKAHVNARTKSANCSLAFLRRNLSSCPKDIKLQCYKSLVRPVLDYAAAAWDHHTQTCITQLEAVQRRAARFITGNYRTTSSTSQMIADLGLLSLELHRQHSKFMMMYRITYGLVDIPANHHLRQSTTSTRGHGLEDMDGRVIRYWIPYTAGQTYIATPSSSLERVCGISYQRN